MRNDFEDEFVLRFRQLKKSKLPNFSEKTSQKLNDNFETESYILWKNFENFENLITLNQRKIIKSYGGVSLFLNLNSSSFVRDANYSLSLVKDSEEKAIISFFPVDNTTIRIVQLQGKKGFDFEFNNLSWKDILMDEIKIFSNTLGFKNLEILRAEQNYLIKFPRNIGPEYDMDKHKERFLYIYNVLPIKRWGFRYNKGDFYSKFKF